MAASCRGVRTLGLARRSIVVLTNQQEFAQLDEALARELPRGKDEPQYGSGDPSTLKFEDPDFPDFPGHA